MLKFNWNYILSRWLPAILMMLVIFYFSAQTSSNLPNFDWADAIVKKGGHVTGYAILAFLYWRALEFKMEKRWLAWLLAVLYAVTDELHQRLSAGRHPSIWDVMIFDNLGAGISLWLANLYRKQKRPDRNGPAAPEKTVHRK
jgi:VanZ family protein